MLEVTIFWDNFVCFYEKPGVKQPLMGINEKQCYLRIGSKYPTYTLASHKIFR